MDKGKRGKKAAAKAAKVKPTAKKPTRVKKAAAKKGGGAKILGSNRRLRFTITDLVTPPRSMLASNNVLIESYNWDTISALRLPDVNAAIVSQHSSPSSFDAEKDYGGGVIAHGVGAFGDWRVAMGGSAMLLHMHLPLPSGTLTWMGTAHPYVSGLATIEVKLQYLPASARGVATKGKQNLVVKARVKTANEDPVVSITNLVFTGVQPDPIVAPFLRDTLEQWLNQNLDQFNHVFAVASLGDKADKEAMQWLKPTAYGYAYTEPAEAEENDCIFAVLAMTEGRTAAHVSWQVSPEVIPAGARSGLYISGERYLKKCMLPDLPNMFENASIADFTVSGLKIANNKELKMKSYKHLASTYTPYVATNKFVAEFNQDELKVMIENAHINISPGIDAYLDYTVYAGIQLLASGDQQVLHVYDVKPLDSNHVVEIAPWVEVTEIITGLIAGVIFTGVGSVAGKAASRAIMQGAEVEAESITAKVVKWLITGIIGGIVGGIVGTIATMVEANANKDLENMPPFDPFVTEAAGSITWPGATGMVLQNVAFNAGMLIGLNPFPT